MSARAKISQKLTKSLPISSVAMLLIGTTLGGQILGFLRVKLILANFNSPLTPAGQNAGVYFAAFNIPDFFFYTIAAGALGVAVIPFLSDHFNKGDKRGMWELSVSLMNLLAVIMAVVAVVIFIFAKPLLHHIVAPGLTPEQLNNATTLMRFLAFDPLLFTISGILASAQQTVGRFFFYAISPLFYNLSIIISVYVFRDNIGIVGLGIGALVGAILQLLIIVAGTSKMNFHWSSKILWRSKDFRSMLRQLPPRSLDQGMDQVQSITDTHFASSQVLGGANAISNYNSAYILHTAPILLIGTAISTAVFPRLNKRLSQGRPDLFRKEFLMTIRIMVWLTMPVMIVSYFGRGYLARLIFGNNNPEISLVFGFLVGAIFFSILYTIISRWFYSHKDTITPLLVSVFIVGFNIFLAWQLSKPDSYGLAGLALAQTIVAGIEVAILTVIMLLRDHKLFDRDFVFGIIRTLSVTGFSLIAGFVMISFFPLGIRDVGISTLGGKFLLITIIVFLVHLGVSALLGLDEVKPFLDRVKKLVYHPIHFEE